MGGGGSDARDYPFEYFLGSTGAALINYPLWRASAIGQSGFQMQGQAQTQQHHSQHHHHHHTQATTVVTDSAVSGVQHTNHHHHHHESSATTRTLTNLSQSQSHTYTNNTNNITTTPKTSSILWWRHHRLVSILAPYGYAFTPPYKGAIATVGGMAWARGAIFWGSDYGREYLTNNIDWGGNGEHPNQMITILLPPLLVSTLVQFVNMPIVRATITIQNPQSTIPNVRSAIHNIYKQHGMIGLWHGTSAGILKTVPKYCTAVIVKDYMEETLPKADQTSTTYETDRIYRSALKSMVAGLAGAVLTNPLDVIRNEMFKTNLSLRSTVQQLYTTTGYHFLIRGIGKNMIAVAVPLACTIFFTDALIIQCKK